ncbi:hypothetical protein ACFFV7_26710 [Nonomuraea spiralis]|uniref:Uncharacterized protein n=1 Tax=Nonomuraea spiralis TaxID=46182 RepID=A0ABV5IL67_9ACTN|nr:hypothetical protein [Nonomuraea spiralis]
MIRRARRRSWRRLSGKIRADLVLACGVFGDITDEDIRRTAGH